MFRESSAGDMILHFNCRVAVLSSEDLEQYQSETAPATLRVFRVLVCFTKLILFLRKGSKFQSRKVTWMSEPYPRDYKYRSLHVKSLISFLFTSFLIPYRERVSLRASEQYGIKNEYIHILGVFFLPCSCFRSLRETEKYLHRRHSQILKRPFR